MRYIVFMLSVALLFYMTILFLAYDPLLTFTGLFVALMVFCYLCPGLINGVRQIFSNDSNVSIEVIKPIEIGDTSQYIHIRGTNTDNPLLLFLHGGPGFTNIGWFDNIQKSWEEYFTVVQWDQRQSGKSYGSAESLGESMTFDQLLADAKGVVEYLCHRFKQDKLVIMGTSYGTCIGIHLAKDVPERIHAYIAVGQIVNMMQHAQTEHRLLLDYAKQHNHLDKIDKLTAISPHPNPEQPAESFFSHSYFMLNLGSEYGKCYPKSLSHFVRWITLKKIFSPHYSWKDIYHMWFGDAPVVTNMEYGFAQEFIKTDIEKSAGYHFSVPIFFFTGTDDWHISADSSKAYFDRIETTVKEHVLFEQSAHVPFITEPGLFLVSLVNHVLPVIYPVTSSE